MLFEVLSDNGAALDAHFDVAEGVIHFLSRGGAKGKSARNADYSMGLRLLLDRLRRSGFPLEGIWVDSSQVQHLPLEERLVLGGQEWPRAAEDALHLISSRMRSVGQSKDTKGGNSTKRLRLELTTSLTDREIGLALGGRVSEKDLRSEGRLPADELNRVTAEHVWEAVQQFVEGGADPNFGPSTDYDLLTDYDTRLPPKAVFGRAATIALGLNVLPRHFSAGWGSPCFRILEESGFRIVPKGEEPGNLAVPEAPEDRTWGEGNPEIRAHLRKERARGLSQAKKAAFKRQHGALFCERCGLDPVSHYSSEMAESCIEAHHRATQVRDMAEGHRTSLDDLQCLCANCHRLVHRELRQIARDGGGSAK